jgi:hypothetical protein
LYLHLQPSDPLGKISVPEERVLIVVVDLFIPAPAAGPELRTAASRDAE